MRFKSTIGLHAQGEVIRRDPGFWDRFKTLFGARPSLDTDRVRTQLTTALLVQGARQALERLGVTNAIALVIDGQVLFEDTAGRADDFGDLFLAFYQNQAAFGRELGNLRLTVEHREGGLHYVLEIVGRGEHLHDEATATVIVAGRITELEPLPGEDAGAFEARVAPHLETPAFTETHRLRYESFVTRVRDGLRDALPDVRVRSAESQSQVEEPRRAGARPMPEDPRDPRYDPYEAHYPSRLHDVVTALFWSSMMRWASHPYHVVDDVGAPAGSDEELADGDFGGEGGMDSDGQGDLDGGDGGWDEGGGLEAGDGDW